MRRSPAPPSLPGRPLDRRTMLAGSTAALASALLPAPARAAPFVLRAAPAEARLSGDRTTPVLAFGGTVPGPVLRMTEGEPFPLRLENATDRPVSLHWSGMRVSDRVDGVAGLARPAVPPGGALDLDVTPPDPGLFIYRPAVPGRTGDLVARGLSGLAVVAEKSPPLSDADFVVGVADWLLDPQGRIASPSQAELNAGRLGNTVTVNGGPGPFRADVPRGGKIRLRVANLAPARVFVLKIDGAKAYVAAIDGHPTDVFEPLRSTFPLGPGNRIELFVDMPREPKAVVTLAARVGNGVEIARLTTTESLSPSADRPLQPLPPNPRLPAEIRLQAALRTNFSIEGGPRPGLPAPLPWLVNGAAGSLARDRRLFEIGLGRPVVITIANRTALPQTLHLHGHAFRVLHALDDGWDPYWLDTVTVAEGKTVRIAFVADNPGRWLIASAVHDRTDQGLFGWFEVKGS